MIFEQGSATVLAEMVCTEDAEVETQVTPALDPVHIATTVCVADAVDVFGLSLPFCGLADPVTEPGQVTDGVVAAALRRLPLPPSELIVQPPNGRTLVNFDTNFYTQTPPLTRTIRLFGQRVHLRIWPTTYTWHFGDGTTHATTSAGAPYPHLEITHNYTTQGHVAPSVDTTYQAQFRVNNTPWRPVPGTVTIPGDTVTLDVVEATPTLVGYQ